MRGFIRKTLISFGMILWLAQEAWALEVKEFTVAKNVGVWMVEDYHVPVVHVSITFKDAGAASDPKGLEGRAAMAAEMLLEGTTTLDAESFNKALEEGAIEFDTSITPDYFTITLHTLAENKDRAFDLMTQALHHAAMAPAKLDEVKQRIKAAIKQRESTPAYAAQMEWLAQAFPNHPYGRPVYGTQSSVEQLSTEQLNQYRRTHLTRQNVVVSLVGAIKESEAESLLERVLAPLPETFTPDAPVADTELADQPITKHVARDVPQSVIVFGKKGLARSDKDFYAAYVANYLLGGKGLSSRLSEAIRQTHGLAYDVSSELQPMSHASVWQGGFGTRHGGERKAIALLQENMQSMVDQGVTKDEFDAAISYITGSYPLNLDRSESIATYLTLMQLHDLGKDYFEKRNSYFLDVTLDQVNRVVKTLFNPQSLILVQAGRAEETKD